MTNTAMKTVNNYLKREAGNGAAAKVAFERCVENIIEHGNTTPLVKLLTASDHGKYFEKVAKLSTTMKVKRDKETGTITITLPKGDRKATQFHANLCALGECSFFGPKVKALFPEREAKAFDFFKAELNLLKKVDDDASQAVKDAAAEIAAVIAKFQQITV